MSPAKVSNTGSRIGQRDPLRGLRPSVSPDPLVVAKFAVPRRQSVTLRRTRLLRLLRSSPTRSVISIVAPPGYGKTSLLVQWATESSGPVAWLTADDSDSDPVVLLTDLAAAIDRVEPLGTEIFVAIASAAVSNRAVVGRLLAAMSRPPEGVRIAIDDGHRITSRPCLDILAELVAHLPEGSQVAIAGRERMRLPFARWRAEGSLLEIGPAELAMDEREAAALGRELGLRLPADTTARLARRTDGWPALLALATLGARTPVGGPGSIDTGSDQLVEEYLRSEVVEGRPEPEVEFLTRTSILERLSAPLCDAVTEGRGSAAVLRHLAQSTLLVDDYGGAYRYHTLLRDFLRHELAAREPEMMPILHRRAADWYRANLAYEPAVDHAFAAGDLDLAATLVGNGWHPFHWSGRRATIRSWAARFGAEALVARPWLAVLAAWEELANGDVAGTVRFADVAERGVFGGRPPDGTASFEAGRAMLRAAMARRGADDALANATRAVELEGNLGSWLDFALWQLAIARLAVGDQSGADAAFADGIKAAGSSGHHALQYCLLGHRALMAAGLGAWDAAAALIGESDAIEPAPLVDGYFSSIPSRAAHISLATHRGDVAGARRELARAMGLRPLMTAAGPAGAVMCLLAFARAHLAVDDPAGARALVAQAKDVIRDRPDLGVLPAEADALWAILTPAVPRRAAGATSLSVAELRVLAFLPYYLSYKEIGQRLGVRETTVKSQVLAIFGKLGAATRGDAVDMAVDAGLLERFLPVSATRPAEAPAGG